MIRGGPNGYGSLEDRSHSRRPATELLGGAAQRFGEVQIKGAADLRPFEPEVMDQGESSTCYAHCHATAMYTTAGAQSLDLFSFVPSPKGIADAYRVFARARDYPGVPARDLPPLVDIGGVPSDVIQAVAAIGVRPTKAPAPDGRNSDVDPATINDGPTLGDFEQDSQCMIVGEYFIDQNDSDADYQVAAMLDAGIACTIAVYVDTAFQEWNPSNGPMGPGDRADTARGCGWHDIAITYYRTESDGSLTFGGPNSWGKSWGIAGRWEGNGAFIRAGRSIVVATVRRIGG